MGNDVMKREYKNREQRFAVCNSLWKEAKKNARSK